MIKGKLGTSNNVPKDDVKDFEADEDEDEQPVTILDKENTID